MKVALHTRKIMTIGPSLALVIPPHVLDIMGGKKGDYVIFDTSAPPFVVISVVRAPPYATDPAKYDTPPTSPF